MKLDVLQEYATLQEEIEAIAAEILAFEKPDTKEEQYYIDDVVVDYINKGYVKINWSCSGRNGFYDSGRITMSTAEFCNPKWLLGAIISEHGTTPFHND